MKTCNILGAAAVLALACSLSCAAQDKGYWRAASSNANAITGDFTLSPTKVTLDFLSFAIAPIRSLSAAEVAAAFDADAGAGINGALYRLNVPADQRFLRKNTLCGTEDTQWMATYVHGRTLQVAFFSGEKAPVFTFEALSNSADVCGTFTYAR